MLSRRTIARATSAAPGHYLGSFTCTGLLGQKEATRSLVVARRPSKCERVKRFMVTSIVKEFQTDGDCVDTVGRMSLLKRCPTPL